MPLILLLPQIKWEEADCVSEKNTTPLNGEKEP